MSPSFHWMALTERRIAQAKSFDAQPCSESKISDLALGQLDAYRREAVDAETIAANHRPLEQQLASLRLYDPDRHCATHAGMLLVGKNPRFYLPGTSLTEIPSDQAEVSGDLHTVLKELLGRLKLLIKTAMVRINPLQEKLVPNYPEGAVRELFLRLGAGQDTQTGCVKNTKILAWMGSVHQRVSVNLRLS